MTDPLGNTTTYSYTATGQNSTVSNPGSERRHRFLPVRPRRPADRVHRPNSNTTTTDMTGSATRSQSLMPIITPQPIRMIAPNRADYGHRALGDTTVYGYDASRNQKTVTDGLGHTTTTLYDALNRATTIISAVAGTTTITYDAAGRETSLTIPRQQNPVGIRFRRSRDDIDPAQRSHGHLRLRRRRRAHRHDRRRRPPHDLFLQRRRRPDRRDLGRRVAAETITYTYDADNEMTGAADSFATLTFTYDSGGNQITGHLRPGHRPAQRDPDFGLQRPAQPHQPDRQPVERGITTYAYDAGQRSRRLRPLMAGRRARRSSSTTIRPTGSRRNRARSAAAARLWPPASVTTRPTGKRRSRTKSPADPAARDLRLQLR